MTANPVAQQLMDQAYGSLDRQIADMRLVTDRMVDVYHFVFDRADVSDGPSRVDGVSRVQVQSSDEPGEYAPTAATSSLFVRHGPARSSDQRSGSTAVGFSRSTSSEPELQVEESASDSEPEPQVESSYAQPESETKHVVLVFRAGGRRVGGVRIRFEWVAQTGLVRLRHDAWTWDEFVSFIMDHKAVAEFDRAGVDYETVELATPWRPDDSVVSIQAVTRTGTDKTVSADEFFDQHRSQYTSGEAVEQVLLYRRVSPREYASVGGYFTERLVELINAYRHEVLGTTDIEVVSPERFDDARTTTDFSVAVTPDHGVDRVVFDVVRQMVSSDQYRDVIESAERVAVFGPDIYLSDNSESEKWNIVVGVGIVKQ